MSGRMPRSALPSLPPPPPQRRRAEAGRGHLHPWGSSPAGQLAAAGGRGCGAPAPFSFRAVPARLMGWGPFCPHKTHINTHHAIPPQPPNPLFPPPCSLPGQEPLAMSPQSPSCWEAEVRVPLASLPCTYKYALRRLDGALHLEAGENRLVALPANEGARPPALVARLDGCFRRKQRWRGAGIAVPVFSLRRCVRSGGSAAGGCLGISPRFPSTVPVMGPPVTCCRPRCPPWILLRPAAPPAWVRASFWTWSSWWTSVQPPASASSRCGRRGQQRAGKGRGCRGEARGCATAVPSPGRTPPPAASLVAAASCNS